MNKTDLGLLLGALGVLLALRITPVEALCFVLGALFAAALTLPDEGA